MTEPTTNDLRGAPSDREATRAATVDPKEPKPKAESAARRATNADKREHTTLEKIGFGVAVLALCATGWQAYIANDTEQRSLRAYVFIDGVILDIQNNYAKVTFTIKNSGQTPAYAVRWWTAIGIREYPVPESEFKKPDSVTINSVDTMARDVTAENIALKDYPNGVPFIGTRVDGTRGLVETALIAFGRIDYEDTFRRKCWTTFRYYVGADIGLNGAHMASMKSGNDADRNCDDK